MTRNEDLIQYLLQAPEKIREAEDEVILLENRRREQEFMLKDKEARLLADESGPINGKNAEIRAAQLFGLTGPERVLLLDLEGQVAAKKVALNYQRLLHRSWLAIAALLSAAPDSEPTVG